MTKTNKKGTSHAKRGFTLIELLVVIGIIAVLAGVVVIALNPLERIKESRDSKRLQDIQAVRQAVDLGLADGEITLNGAPGTPVSGTSAGTNTTIDATGTNGWVKVSTATGATGLVKYMPLLPTDPQGSSAPGVGYEWQSDSVDYIIRTSFETDKYRSGYAATDGGPDDTKYETGSKAGLTFTTTPEP